MNVGGRDLVDRSSLVPATPIPMFSKFCCEGIAGDLKSSGSSFDDADEVRGERIADDGSVGAPVEVDSGPALERAAVTTLAPWPIAVMPREPPPTPPWRGRTRCC
jgi:hypothetical protein